MENLNTDVFDPQSTMDKINQFMENTLASPHRDSDLQNLGNAPTNIDDTMNSQDYLDENNNPTSHSSDISKKDENCKNIEENDKFLSKLTTQINTYNTEIKEVLGDIEAIKAERGKEIQFINRVHILEFLYYLIGPS